MQLTLLNGYPDLIGKRFAFAGYSSGSPASYSPVTGDPVALPAYENYIDAIPTCLSVSGNYDVKFQPSGTGARQTWTAYWFYSGKQGVTGVSGTGGTGMTPGTYALSFSGGGGTGAAGTVTVTGATAFSTPVITASGSGYTSAPTVSAATGGTPPTLTAAVAAGSGAVANTTNLSTESVQLSGFGGRY